MSDNNHEPYHPEELPHYPRPVHLEVSLREVLDKLIDQSEVREMELKSADRWPPAEAVSGDNEAHGDPELQEMLSLREDLFREVDQAGGMSAIEDPEKMEAMKERMLILNSWIRQRRKDLGLDPDD